MELAQGVHVIEAEFWGRPLYLPLFVGERIALVDTGLAGMGMGCVVPYLQRLGRRPQDLDLIINTHAHTDHIGGNHELWEAGGRRLHFAAHRLDRRQIEDPRVAGAEPLLRYVELGLLAKAPLETVLAAAGPGTVVDQVLDGGECIDLGDGLALEVLHTPGHTLGSISLYEKRNRVLVTAEAVAGAGQFGTAGNLTSVPYYADLRAYLGSLTRLAQIDFTWLVDAHAAPRPRSTAPEPFAASLAFCRWFDQDLQSRIRAGHGPMGTLALHSSLYGPAGQYPADLGMAMLIDTHLRSLLERGIVTGSLAEGVVWQGIADDPLALTVRLAGQAIGMLPGEP